MGKVFSARYHPASTGDGRPPRTRGASETRENSARGDEPLGPREKSRPEHLEDLHVTPQRRRREPGQRVLVEGHQQIEALDAKIRANEERRRQAKRVRADALADESHVLLQNELEKAPTVRTVQVLHGPRAGERPIWPPPEKTCAEGGAVDDEASALARLEAPKLRRDLE